MTPTRSAEKAGAAQAIAMDANENVSAYAWYVCIVLTLCYMLSYIDRQILGTFVGPIRQEFGVTDAQYGMLQGLGFAIFYTFMGLPIGRGVDRWNRRNLIVGGVLIWSFFTLWCAMAHSYNMLFLGRIGVGVGEATLGPAAFSILADYFPRNRLGLAGSIFYVGNLAGASLALIIGGAVREAAAGTQIVVPLLGTFEGWRIAFLLLGIPGMLFAFGVFTVKEPVRRGAMAVHPTLAVAVAEIRKRWKSVLGIAFAFAMQAACNYAFNAWAVEYFLRVHQWQPGETTRALGFLLIVCGCSGLYAGGWIADRWQRQGKHDAMLRIAIPSAFGTFIFLPLAMLASTPGMALALAAPGLFAVALPMGTAGAAFQHIVPNQVRGLVTAFYLFILNIGGLPIGNYLPGYLTTNVFKDPLALGKAVAITIGICGLVMFGLVIATRKSYQRDYEAMHGVK